MDNALQMYLQQKNQLPSPDQLNAPLMQQQQQGQPQGQDVTMQALVQSRQQLNNALAAYQQGKASPQDVQSAQSQWAGMCEAWAEQQTYGHTGVFPSASAAAQHFAQTGKLNPDVTKAPKGALVYFSDPNQPNGHVGVARGDGTFTSATYNGIQTNPLDNWQKATGQKAVGYVMPGGN